MLAGPCGPTDALFQFQHYQTRDRIGDAESTQVLLHFAIEGGG
jgi:hypothetical protein